MRTISILAAFIFSLQICAFTLSIDEEDLKSIFETQGECGNAIRFDDDYAYIGFGAYRNSLDNPRKPIVGRVKLVSLVDSSQRNLRTRDSAIDFISYKGLLYILTYTSIEVWDLSNMEKVDEIETYSGVSPFYYKENPEAFTRYKNFIIVAHGRLGVSYINIDTRKIVHQERLIRSQAPMESMATGVQVIGDEVFISMDNFTLQSRTTGEVAFRGIVVADAHSFKVKRELAGLDPGSSDLMSFEDDLVVSFNGMPIWRYDTKKMSGDELPHPFRMWKFPVRGHPKGKGVFTPKYFYTCYLKAPDRGGYYQNIPLVLNSSIILGN